MTPRARSNRIENGNPVRVYVTAPPAGGQANIALCDLVSRRLGRPKSSVLIVKGKAARLKTLRIEGMDDAEILADLTRDGGL